jgi:hypothetical protein
MKPDIAMVRAAPADLPALIRLRTGQSACVAQMTDSYRGRKIFGIDQDARAAERLTCSVATLRLLPPRA